MFDLPGEPLVLINPPVDAVLAGVVWKHSLSWPHLRGTECEICVYKHFFLIVKLREHQFGITRAPPLTVFTSDFILAKHTVMELFFFLTGLH